MQNILELLSGNSTQSAIVIRHAERFELTGAQSYWTCGLTAAGTEQAHALGRTIAGRFSSYRIFHSPVKRCEQTALAISAELGVDRVHPEKTLGVSYIRVSVDEGFAEADKHSDFIRSWFDGRVPPNVFMPMPEAMAIQTAYLRSKFISAPEGSLDIHVTHDWNINVLREGIFGIRHEDAGWPDFLSGMAFSESNGSLTAHLQHGGKALSAAIPL